MKIIDLVNLGKSEIKYKVSKFPDGQQSITLEDNDELKMHLFNREDVKINSHLNSWLDIELIICANQALKQYGFGKNYLYVPYFLGARSDRKFSSGGVNYLKNVIGPVINSQKFKKVIVLDPHSHVLEAVIDNYLKVDNLSLIKFAINDFAKDNDLSNTILIAPDKGASDKVMEAAKNLKMQNPIIEAIKHRNIDGQITHTSVSGVPTVETSLNFVILDDICDGGRTFIELVKVLQEVRPKEQFNDRYYLIVTHGIFSAGFSQLSKIFDNIYCTDSIKVIPSIVELNTGSTPELIQTKVKQYGVF